MFHTATAATPASPAQRRTGLSTAQTGWWWGVMSSPRPALRSERTHRAVLKSNSRFSDEAHGQVDSTTHAVSEGRIGSITFARLTSRPGAIFSLHRPT